MTRPLGLVKRTATDATGTLVPRVTRPWEVGPWRLAALRTRLTECEAITPASQTHSARTRILLTCVGLVGVAIATLFELVDPVRENDTLVRFDEYWIRTIIVHRDHASSAQQRRSRQVGYPSAANTVDMMALVDRRMSRVTASGQGRKRRRRASTTAGSNVSEASA